MQPNVNKKFQPYVESVEDIVSAMKLKQRYVEEQNDADYPDASEVIRNKLLTFEGLFSSAKSNIVSDQNLINLNDAQKRIFEKVIENANLGIESHNLKVIRDSIKELESFQERIRNS